MIATWPNVPKDRLPRDPAKRKAELLVRWARLIGASPDELARPYDKLFDNEFLRIDGTVDPWADKYVEAMMVASLPKEVRPRGKRREAAEDQPADGTL